MNRFSYVRPATVADAVAAKAGAPAGRFIAGGTNLVDLMKSDVERPPRLIDIARLPGMDAVTALPDGGMRVGAMVTNARVAYDRQIAAAYPLLAEAILAGASAQLRNAATTGGNLLQRTRCHYFYDPSMACNKRTRGAGCAAIGGVTRMHAILGASEHCIATHPSDMCVALAALEAVVQVRGPQGARAIPMAEFHRLPGDRPDLDTTLAADEIVTSVDLPPARFLTHTAYMKLRDRASYAFAVVSVAATLRLQGGRIEEARLALGGVAHKPWRRPEAEDALRGRAPEEAAFDRAADILLDGARGQGDNDFKIGLARAVLLRALAQAASGGSGAQGSHARA